MNHEPSHAQESGEDTSSPGTAPDIPSAPVWRPALKEAGWAFLAAAAVLASIYTVTFERVHPEFARFMERDARPLTAFGKDFLPVSIGKGQQRGQDFVVDDFNGDEAILVLPRAFDAEDYPFIKVNLSGFTRYSKAKILWQRSGDSQTHALEFNRSGDEVTQIAMVHGGGIITRGASNLSHCFFTTAPPSGSRTMTMWIS